jgi:hypothetical protein
MFGPSETDFLGKVRNRQIAAVSLPVVQVAARSSHQTAITETSAEDHVGVSGLAW